MKVRARWLPYRGKSSFNIRSHLQKFQIETVSIDYCCHEMEISDAVRFGEWDSMLNRNSDVNISTCSPYPEGAVWDEEAINFCPFCGTKIEVEITNG